MKKLLNFILLILTINIGSIQLAIAQTDSMNYFLEKRKNDIEPFDSSKVKIDLESLGLDVMDNNKKDKSILIDNNQANQAQPNKNAKQNAVEIPKRPILSDEVRNEKSNISSQANPIKSVDENKVNLAIEKSSQETENNKIIEQNEKAKTPKINPYKAINEKKKRELANRLKQESSMAKIVNLKKNKNKKNSLVEENLTSDSDITIAKNKKENSKEIQKKIRTKNEILNELRRIYLGDERDEKIQRLQQIDDDFIDNEIITPRPKDLSAFALDELPAFPILSPNRTEDNFHIPCILTPRQKITMLFDAIKDGDVLRFIEIFKQVQNPNLQNEHGDTLLTNAILAKKYAIMAEILAHGADPDLPNQLGYTPIEIAVEMLDFIALKLLVENRANINSIDRFGRTYLMHSSRVGFLPAVDLFVKNGIDINAVDNDGFSALSIAYRHKKEVVVQYLIKNGSKQWMERKNIPEKQTLINELENRWK